MNRSTNSDRRCKVCGAKLSSYNPDTLCYPCQEKEDESLGLHNYKVVVNREFCNSVKREIYAIR